MPPNDLRMQTWFNSLPDRLQDSIQRTNRIANRDIAVYFRSYHGSLRLMFDSVPDSLRERAAIAATFSVALNCYLDYWADTAGRADLIEEAADHLFRGAPLRSPEISDFASIWSNYLEVVGGAPRFEQTCDLLMHEWSRFFDSLRYSIHINEHIETPDQPFTYQSALTLLSGNMLGTHKHIIDMGFVPEWKEEWTESVIRLGRSMDHVIRIGNCLKSWRQEILLHADFSSTVCAVAIEHGVMDPHTLRTGAASLVIAKIASTPILTLGGETAEQFLLRQALGFISGIESMKPLEFVDIERYVDALKQTIEDQSQGNSESR